MSLRTGAWLLVAALGLVFSGFVSSARAADPAAGNWKWEFKRQNGNMVEMTLKLKQDGEKLTGTISGPRGNGIAIDEGAIKDGTVTFKVTREINGNTFVTKYNGKLSGDTIKGKMETERNGQSISRDWEAQRS